MIIDRTRKLNGNKCGHEVHHPKLYFTPTFYKTRPKLINKTRRRANSVAEGRGWENPLYLKYYKSMRNECVSLRKQRSEARSRFSQVVGVLLDHYDFESKQLGHWDTITGMFTPVSWAKLHTILEINQMDEENFSRDRFYEEIKMIRDAGYIRVQKRHYDTGEVLEAKDGQESKDIIRQDVAHKWVQDRLFLELGITQEEIDAQRKITKARNNKIRLDASQRIPFGDAAKALKMMIDSAKNGTRSKIREYYETKKAKLAVSVSPAAISGDLNKFQKKEQPTESEERERKINVMMTKLGMTRRQAEKYILK